ncbi:MAG: hypothetical protein S4CHLAM2_04120 [Chlamydiales bacterium]|nr:hypothetical protein [Chlamydiales bacterium]
MKKQKTQLVGRAEEQKILKDAYRSSKAEFVAIYGRRRVGKTFLVKTLFEDLDCFFVSVSGMKDGNLKQQIKNFMRSIERALYKGANVLKPPASWMDVFELLTNLLEKEAASKKIVLFLDELPWLASRRSNCLQALDYYWNQHWSRDPRFKLIVCGSTASWIIKNIINNKGGLYNRITSQFRLNPFTLKEASNFLRSKKIQLSKRQVLELYLAIGGIPYYLEQVKENESAAQAIERMAFSRNGVLFNDFDNLFSALFENAGIYIDMIQKIAQHRYGIEQKILFSQIEIPKGGHATQIIKDLEEAGFVITFVPHGHKKRGKYIRIIDEYVSFYLKWISPYKESVQKLTQVKKSWLVQRNSQSWRAWSGYAFENVCYKHIDQIHAALDLDSSAIATTWRHDGKSGEDGAQIDLLFDRQDDSITVCEIKHTDQPFQIDKSYCQQLKRKVATYKKVTKTHKEIFLAFITSSGLKKTLYSEEYVSGLVMLEDLFK